LSFNFFNSRTVCTKFQCICRWQLSVYLPLAVIKYDCADK
jgi:hypothetical protein